MTLNQFHNRLHYLFTGDTSTPSSSDSEYTLRTELLSDAIDAWDSENGIVWSELWQQLSDASDGDTTVVANTRDYNCPTDFRFPGGFVLITDSNGDNEYVRVVKQEEAELLKNLDQKACYFTGNKKIGFDLHFLYQPTAGTTINYPYYKDPFKPSSSSDVIEMSDPTFAVYYALSQLHEMAGSGDRATLALAKAQARLDGMKTKNLMATWFQDNSVPDRDYAVNTGGFGV